jgi:hypothetical protein
VRHSRGSGPRLALVVKASHWLGRDEPREITIGDYRREQGLPEYDELARG